MLEPKLLLDLLAQSATVNGYAAENRDRRYGLFAGVVSDNLDPINKRRIKVTTSDKGGMVTTDWLFPMQNQPHHDPPIPQVGDTIICAYLNGNPHDGIWLGNFTNERNPEDSQQSDIVNDSSTVIPGDNRETVRGFSERTVEGDYSSTAQQTETRRTEDVLDISSGTDIHVHNDILSNITMDRIGNIRIQNGAGAFIWLTANGAVILGSAFGQLIVLGGASASVPDYDAEDCLITPGGAEGKWDMQGSSFRIVNANDITVSGDDTDGNSVATIGADDTDGDTLITRGW